MQLAVNFNFLHAAVNHWDSNHHLFLFKGDEIAPLPGEFEALLGFSTNTFPLTYSSPLSDPKSIFQIFFGLSDNNMTNIGTEEGVNLIQFIDHLVAPRDNMTKQRSKIRALCYCRIVNCLLRIGKQYGYYSMVSIVEQIEGCHSPAPLALAKILLCLNRLRGDPNENGFTGSPLLLHVRFFLRRLSAQVTKLRWHDQHNLLHCARKAHTTSFVAHATCLCKKIAK